VICSADGVMNGGRPGLSLRLVLSQLLVPYRTKGVRGWREMKANQIKLDADFQRRSSTSRGGEDTARKGREPLTKPLTKPAFSSGIRPRQERLLLVGLFTLNPIPRFVREEHHVQGRRRRPLRHRSPHLQMNISSRRSSPLYILET